MLLFCLFLILVVLLYLEYRLFERSYLAPAVLFTAGFCACALGASLYQFEWGYALSPELFFMLLAFILLFGVVCYAVRCATKSSALGTLEIRHFIPVKALMLYIYFGLQCVVFIASLVNLWFMFPEGSIVEAIGSFNEAAKFAATQYGSYSEVAWIFPLGPLRTICDACSYLMLFLLVQELIINRKNVHWAIYANCIMAFAITLETGSRGVAVGYVIFSLACFFILRSRLNGRWLRLSKKQTGIVVLAIVVFLALFRVMAIGREGSFSLLEYLSIYLGGQIPSLDLFIADNGLPTSDFFGQQTFRGSLEYVGKYLGIDAWTSVPYTLDFQSMNGHLLGNLYTTFYPFLQDGGIIGGVICTAVMGAVAQFAYGKAISVDSKRTDLTILIYACMVSPLLLSFFADRFYSDILSVPFLRTLFIIIVVRWIYLNFGASESAKQPMRFVSVSNVSTAKGRSQKLSKGNGRIGVVIVAYNRKDCLEKALQAFEVQTVAPAYILVVDNASTDGTADLLKSWADGDFSRCPRLVFTENENIGGSGGFHDGLRIAQGWDADWIWLSDDDAYPEPGCLEIAETWIKNHDTHDVAAVCGAVINKGVVDTGHRRMIRVRNMRVCEDQIPEPAYEGEFEINALSFVGAIIKKSVIQEVGLPLEDYFIWYDDTEYSLRLSELGRIVCIPAIRINHDASKSDDYLTWKGYYGQRNCLDMIMRHFSKPVYLYSRLRARAKALRLRRLSGEVGKMYSAAIDDQAVGNFGTHRLYKPGWKPDDAS